MAVAVVDFDKTLIKVDSTVLMLKTEGWYLSPTILFWGGILFIWKLVAPLNSQYWLRRKFRHSLFQKIYHDQQKFIEKYTPLLTETLNQDLLNYIESHYDKVYLSTAAWKDLAEQVLQKHNLNWPVYGTEYHPEFRRFFTCWHAEKVRRLQASGISNFDVFTDSDEDGPLMEAAQKVFLVKDGTFSLCSKKS